MCTTLPSAQCHPSAHCLLSTHHLGVNNSSTHGHQATSQLIWSLCPFHSPVCMQSCINHCLGFICPLQDFHPSPITSTCCCPSSGLTTTHPTGVIEPPSIHLGFMPFYSSVHMHAHTPIIHPHICTPTIHWPL